MTLGNVQKVVLSMDELLAFGEQAATVALEKFDQTSRLENHPLMTSEEVSRRFNVHVNRIYDFISAGYLKAVPFNARLHRFRPADVLACEEALMQVGELKREEAENE